MEAETAVRPTSLPAARLVAPLAAAAAALVILAVAFFLVGGPAVVLAGCVVAGFGITYLSGSNLNLEERLAFGTVLGAMAVAAAGFIVSMLAHDVTAFTVLVGLAIALAAG